jgi:hypothetical protein
LSIQKSQFNQKDDCRDKDVRVEEQISKD